MDTDVIKIAVSQKFNLETAVCNHGFFMMAPNKWIPSPKALIRPLSLHPNNIVLVSITHPSLNHNHIIVSLINKQLLSLSFEERQSLESQVSRMLRISTQDDLMIDEFHKLHPLANKSGFGRIIRSPTLFEDIVKSILLCNCTWARSLEMAEGLCNLQYELYGKKGPRGPKRKLASGLEMRWSNFKVVNFPSWKEIACLDVVTLNKHCNLGYRAELIHKLATDIQNGELMLDDPIIPTADATYEELATSNWNRLINRKGFGPFTAANVMMCMGFYQHIPFDTETVKHLEQVHGIKTVHPNRNRNRKTDKVIAQIYDKYRPFQCLAYWMERVEYYEKNLGKLSELPQSEYRRVTSTNLIM